MNSMPYKKICSLLTAASLILTACGNTIIKAEPYTQTTKQNESNTAVEHSATLAIKNLYLPYYPSDSLEPYSAKTVQNFSLRTLIYDSLFVYNGTVSEPQIATSIVQNESSAVITLGSDIYFSNGTILTAEDVLNSFNQAKVSSQYSTSLAEITSMEILGTDSIRLELSKPSPLLTNVLTFPIYKKLENGTTIGTGRFYMKDEATLEKNPYNKTEIKTVKKIYLKPIENNEMLNFNLAEGSFSLYYSDLSVPSDIGMGVGFKQVPLNNLIFLDFNSATVPTSLRKAIFGQIDRQKITENAYDGFATALSMPIRKLSSVDIQNSAPMDILTSAGYTQNEEKKLMQGTTQVKLKLITTKDETRSIVARLVTENLAKLGIEVTVEQLEFNTYKSRISANNYDIFLGEIKLSDDEDLSSILTKKDEAEILEKYYAYQQGTLPVEEFAKLFSENVPFCPIAFRNGVLYYNRSFQAPIYPTAHDVFYNIQSW